MIRKGQWVDNDTGDILYPQTSADMITEDSSHRFVTDAEKANWNSIPRDNILVNGDFRYSAINQRGASVYNSNAIYTIDRWFVGSAAGSEVAVYTMNVYGTFIKIQNTGTPTIVFRQPFVGALDSNSYTVFVKVRNIVGTCTIVAKDANNSTLGNKTLAKGDNILTFEGSPKMIEVQIASGGTIELQCVKLEEGSAFTGMAVFNKELELIKCQSKTLVINTNDKASFFVGATSARTSRIAMYIPLPVKLRKTPSATGNYTIKFRYYTDSEHWALAPIDEISVCTDNQVVLALSVEGLERNVVGECYVEGRLILDAEIY